MCQCLFGLTSLAPAQVWSRSYVQGSGVRPPAVRAGRETVSPWPPATSLQHTVSLRRPPGSLRPVVVSVESQPVPVSTVTDQPPRPAAGHLGSRECRLPHLIPGQLVLGGRVESRLEQGWISSLARLCSF
jgi:hypothetical protein